MTDQLQIPAHFRKLLIHVSFPGEAQGILAMALTWQPDAGSLQQIMILLKESQSSDTKTQQELKPVSMPAFVCVACVCVHETLFLQKLEALNQYPDFNNYLVYVFTKVLSLSLTVCGV